METVLDTTELPREDRFRVWQEQICDVHFNVDVSTDAPLDHYLRVRAGLFGAMTLTNDMGAAGVASRSRHHLSKGGDDDVKIMLVTDGTMDVVQSGVTSKSHSGAWCFYRTSEPFELIVPDKFQSVILTVPRAQLAERFRSGHLPHAGCLAPSGAGLGRIAVEFCHQLALESRDLDKAIRTKLGEQALDILALALDASIAEVGENSIQQARLRSIKAFIEQNLDDLTLSPAKIAGRNEVSLRYLHRLFKETEHSVFEYVWHRRLERCYQMIVAQQHSRRSITEIAYSMGFSNPSHFSNLFRAKFGMRPSDLRRLTNDALYVGRKDSRG